MWYSLSIHWPCNKGLEGQGAKVNQGSAMRRAQKRRRRQWIRMLVRSSRMWYSLSMHWSCSKGVEGHGAKVNQGSAMRRTRK